MRKLFLCSAILSCFVYSNFVCAQTYTSIHTLGKPPIIKAKGTGVLDLTSLIKSNPRFVFAVKDPKSGEISYTRDSLFYGKSDGYYYQDRNRLQGYPVATDITSTDCKLTDIKSAPEEIPAVATTAVEYAGNLNAGSYPPGTVFNRMDTRTFNFRMDATIYDSLGVAHELSVYYIKNGFPAVNSWTTAIYVDNDSIGSGNLTFYDSGEQESATGMDTLRFYPDSGAKTPQEIHLNFAGIKQVAAYSCVWSIISDGMKAGIYSSYMLDTNGYLSSNYNNGQTITFSKVAVFNQQ